MLNDKLAAHIINLKTKITMKIKAIFLALSVFCICSISPATAQSTVTPAQDSAITKTLNDISTYGQQADAVLDQLHVNWGKATTFKDSLDALVQALPHDSAVKAFAGQVTDIKNQVDEHKKTGKSWTKSEIFSLVGAILLALATLIGIIIGRFTKKKTS